MSTTVEFRCGPRRYDEVDMKLFAYGVMTRVTQIYEIAGVEETPSSRTDTEEDQRPDEQPHTPRTGEKRDVYAP